MFSHILVPLDESRLAERVLPHVAALAPLDQARVTLLNVLEPPASNGVQRPADPVEWQLSLGRARSYLEAVRERLQRYAVNAEVELIEGDPTTSILEFARRSGVDLIALTSHGSGGEEMHSLGEVALKTVFGARSSVLLVRSFNPVLPDLPRSDATGTPGSAPVYRNVLVPLDGSLRSESALPYAERICNVSGGCLHVVAVARPEQEWYAAHGGAAAASDGGKGPERHQEREETYDHANRYLDGVSRAASAPQRLLKTSVASDADVVGAIDSLAIAEEVDITVMSAHGAGGGTRTPYGSVTLDLLVYGYSPLLVVQDRAAHELKESHAVRAAKEWQGHG